MGTFTLDRANTGSQRHNIGPAQVAEGGGSASLFNPKQMLIQTFANYLQDTYQAVFGDDQFHSVVFLGRVARRALQIIANSDALYHDLEHTILVTTVGQALLQAKRLSEGADSVTATDWLNLMTALLCHDIGYIKGVCQQDDDQTQHYAKGVRHEIVVLAAGSTDVALSPYHVDRGQQFVQEQFQHETLINIEIVQQLIEHTRFPAPQDALHQDPRGLPGLARAADLIGQCSDRYYLNKLPALFYEFEQTGANQALGYQTPEDVRSGFAGFYWHVVYPYVQDAIALLNDTPAGRQIVADMMANVVTSAG